MLRYIAHRLLGLIPVLIGVSLLVFLSVWVIPGDVVDIMMGDEMAQSAAAIERLRAQMNLDEPIHIRYLTWIGNVLQGDLGVSLISGEPVLDQILRRAPVNFQLMLMAMFFIIVIGIPLGTLAAYKQFTWIDNTIRIGAIFGYVIPNFWLATIAVLIVSLYFPRSGVLNYVPFSEDPIANIRGLLLPGLVLSLTTVTYIVRLTRSTVLDALRQDYVRTARAKGLSERIVMTVHVIPNSMIPVATVLGIQVGVLIGGLVLTEEIFMLPGIGRMILLSIESRDFMVLAGSILFVAVIFVLVNLIIDILYAFLDPRIRY
ncbi:MAG: ABC transporter permease [Gammaproteobacteria bacterium]|nr:MAG: ABC transporter permease [Gammaproteobacteria bacterium]